MVKQSRNFWSKLQERYVFSIRNEAHFQENARASLSIRDVISLISLFLLLMLGLAYLLFRFTPFAFFVGGESPKNKKNLLVISQRTDSLERDLLVNELYYSQLKNVLNGTLNADSLESYGEASIEDSILLTLASEEELALRERIEQEDQFNLTDNDQLNNRFIGFIEPVTGIISSPFSIEKEHFGVDIVAPKGSPVKCIEAGSVVFAGWTSENGNTILIAHNNDLVSAYMHNEKLLKKVGDIVTAGEAIALIGNTGEKSSGYHLHFELWEKGKAIDPETFLNFN